MAFEDGSAPVGGGLVSPPVIEPSVLRLSAIVLPTLLTDNGRKVPTFSLVHKFTAFRYARRGEKKRRSSVADVWPRQITVSTNGRWRPRANTGAEEVRRALRAPGGGGAGQSVTILPLSKRRRS